MTAVTVEDELVAQALEITGISEATELVREALRSLMAREAARQLAAMVGSDPDATLGPRRRHS